MVESAAATETTTRARSADRLSPSAVVEGVSRGPKGKMLSMAGRRGRRKGSKKTSRQRGRSAVTGQFAKVSTARKRKRTHVVETVKRKSGPKRKAKAKARAKRKRR